MERRRSAKVRLDSVLSGAMILLQALVAALAEAGLGFGWASLIVGLAVAFVGLILVLRGKAKISASELAPSRTTEQLRKDANLAREQTR